MAWMDRVAHRVSALACALGGQGRRLRDRAGWSCEGLAHVWRTEASLHQWLWANLASGLLASEILRRLVSVCLDFQGGRLRDDATLLLLEWTGPPGRDS